ncbi:MAG: hypothetical protein R3B72_15915 [Polyangiaceae bacterium]
MLLFEVFLTPGADKSQLLTEDALEATGAQVFTPAEAEFVGLTGVPEDPEGRPRALIACSPSDERFIHSRLEASHVVAAFRMHEVG